MSKTCKFKSKWTIAAAAAVLICTVFMSFMMTFKEQYHVDEIWSYSLSNSTHGAFFYWFTEGIGPVDSPSRNTGYDYTKSTEFADYYNHWHDGTFYHNFLTVQQGEQFDYGNVYYNQVCDVHPPLYYFMLHTVCSFFPDSFSGWQGLVPNLIFYMLTLIVLYLIVRELTGSEKKAVFAMIFWGFSKGAVSDTSFIRMYCMLTFLTVCLAYFHIRFIKEGKTRYAVLAAVVDVLGFLTQYIFYIPAFFFTLFSCLYLLFKKKYIDFFGIGFSALSSVAAAMAIFPMSVIHMFNGAHSHKPIQDFLYGGLVSLFKSIKTFIKCVSEDLMIPVNISSAYIESIIFEIFSLVVVLAAIITFIVLLRRCKSKGQDKKEYFAELFRSYVKKLYKYPVFHGAYAVSVLSIVFSGIFVGQVCPRMGYFTGRYYFFILPLVSIIISQLIIFIAKTILIKVRKKPCQKLLYPISAAAAALIIFGGHNSGTNYYLKQAPDIDIVQKLKGNICFFRSDNHMIHAFSEPFQNAEKVYSSYGDDINLMVKEMNLVHEPYIFISYSSAEDSQKLVSGLNNAKITLLGKMEYTIENQSYYVYQIDPQPA